ncbi:hypothetical protein V1506DRAFT_269262 [Lipomyces tetrasporus]
MLVQNWMASTNSSALTQPRSNFSGTSQSTEADDTTPDASLVSAAAMSGETSTSSSHSIRPEVIPAVPNFRSIVLWGDRKVVINIPHELMNEPVLLSTTELRDYERKVHEWAVRHYKLISGQFHSSCDARDFYDALSCGNATVRIPDEKAWKEHVDYLREKKLLALGVSSPVPSDAFSSPGAMAPHHPMSPEMNGFLSAYNALNIYAPQSVVANTNMYYQPSSSPVPRTAPRPPSTPLSARAPAFVPPPFNDDMATSGLNIDYAQRYLDAPIDLAGVMPTPSPDEQDMQYASVHRRAVSEHSGTESGAFVKPPRESKRIPIVDPVRKFAMDDAKRNESTATGSDKFAANDANRKRERRMERYTPILQSGTAANKLPSGQLDDIVQRLSEYSPTVDKNGQSRRASVQDDDSDSVWSDSVVRSQHQHLAAEAAKRNASLDDATLQALLSDALTKKLDPLEKLVGMLTDQLKNSRNPHAEAHVSDADDEADDYEELKTTLPRQRSKAQENDGSTQEATATDVGSSSGMSSTEISARDQVYIELRAQLATLISRNEALLCELEDARRARERADATVSELTNKIVETERAYSSVRAKVDTYAEEIAKLKQEAELMESRHASELDQTAASIRRDMEREYSFTEKEHEMQKEQTNFLKDQVHLLNDKLKIAASDAERAVDEVKKVVNHVVREKEDVLNSRATELSWLRGLLDTRIEELEDQVRILKSPGETIDRPTLESLYTNSNSAFLSKLKFGTAMSLVSDEFAQLLSTVSDSFVARGVSHKDHRRRLGRQFQLENIMPLNEHNNNVPSNSSRNGYSGGLKDLKLNRAATIHVSGADREELRRRSVREI